MTNRYPEKNLLKAKTVVTMESTKLSNHVLNYFKGSQMDHFDQMLKDISQESQNKNPDLITTTETYQPIQSSLLRELTPTKKVKMNTTLISEDNEFNQKVAYILRTSANSQPKENIS